MSSSVITSAQRPGESRRFDSLLRLLEARAAEAAEQTAYVFLRDGETEEASLTYGGLARRARALGAWLQERGQAGARVLLLYPPGLEYIAAFWGCLYAGAVAVPAYPPRLNRHSERLRAIVADTGAAAALTTTSVLKRLGPLLGQDEALSALTWAATDEVGDAIGGCWRMPDVGRESLAFLQYTSGSTSVPKGVMVTHANLLHNEELIRRCFRQSRDSVIVGWLPLYHDMGLIGNVLQPLYLGASCVLMSPTAFLQKPARWLKAVSQYRATTSGGPNFAYELCVRKVTEEERAGLDLSSWEVAFNGAEPVRAATLRRFYESFAPYGFQRTAFYPCYGLAEATLFVSGAREPRSPVVETFNRGALEKGRAEPAGVGDTRELVGCGSTPTGQQIVVVDPETLIERPAGEVGEVWVAGPSVAAGYWSRPAETERTFGARLAGGGGPFLRTGDLGVITGGELYVTGRLKELIIVRGRNLYPHDIEHTAERSHAALKSGCGAAFSVEAGGEEHLVLVYEVSRRAAAPLDEVLGSIRRALSEEHEVQPHRVVLVREGNVPKTSSGKIQRSACRELLLSSGLEVLGEWLAGEDGTAQAEPTFRRDAVEDEHGDGLFDLLRALLASRLGIGVADVDGRRPMTHYGLDSLAAVEVAHAIETEFGVEWPMASLLEGPSLVELTEQIRARLDSCPAPRTPCAEPFANAALELSHGQRALWFMHRVSPESAAYNVAAAARVRSTLDADALRRALEALAARHASLRTIFEADDGTPVRRVYEQLPIHFEQADASAWSRTVLDEWLSEESLRPFDLAAGPLWRVSLLKRADEEHILLIVAHHIVVDFWSLAVLWREAGELYRAENAGTTAHLPRMTADYDEYVSRQAKLLGGPEGERLWEYWGSRLGSQVPKLDLPTDRPHPPVQTYRGAAYAFVLDAQLTHRLKGVAAGAGVTLYVTLLAAFEALLYRYTGQEDFALGSPTAGRDSASLSGVVGYFVNPIVLRANLSGDPRFADLLGRTRRTVLDAFAHQEYPFALLVQRLQPERDAARSPLFQVMFTFQPSRLLAGEGLSSLIVGETGVSIEFGGLAVETWELPRRTALFDLRLSMTESGEGLAASLEYNTDLFDEPTVRRMAVHFESLLQSAVADPERRLSELSLLTSEERRRLLVEWNDTTIDYGPTRPLHELFEEQVARTPEAVAVIYEGEQVSYGELNRRANRLARRLRTLRVGPDVPVGVLSERSIEMVVALLGVLKAGGAYLPLDPSYPAERLRLMLEDACPAVLLTKRALLETVPGQQTQVVCVDEPELMATSEGDERNVPAGVGGLNLAYVIYTSGSTGVPKGAMNTHAAIVNRLHWMQGAYGLTPEDAVLQKTPYSFDVSVWEFFWPLLTGARLVVARPGGHQEPAYLNELIADERITTLHFVPSMLRTFLAQADAGRCASLRRVICSGEALPFDLQERFQALLGAELHNLYGPTEAAVDVSAWACVRAGQRRSVPIGRPIANTRLYILDAGLRPVPEGIAGELYIGGVQLARGYLNRPALTAERFIPDPFAGEPGGRLYKTGDLAHYAPDGVIEFLGRLDFQVKVRGFRIEPGEIEAALLGHEGVRDCVVLAREDVPGDVRLVAYVVGGPSAGELRRGLRESLPEHMVPTAFVTLDALPLTPSGKVDRRALPPPAAPEPEGGYVAPRDQIEEVIANIWAGVLRVERVGAGDNFFDLGGHSLLAAQVVSRVNEAFQVELPLRYVFESPTVVALAERVTATLRSGRAHHETIERVAREGPLPLSFAQQRLWFLDQLEPGNVAYNIPVAVRLTGALDVCTLERSMREIVHRHEALRTTFVSVAGRPAQVIAPPGPWQLAVNDLGGLAADEREAVALRQVGEEASRPFDLARGPLLRATLWRLADDEHVLLVTMHHAVSDGWSIGVFVGELSALYVAYSKDEHSPLAELPVQYADFAQWQRRRLSGESLAEHLGYWKRQLGGRLPVLELPGEDAAAAAPARAATEQAPFPAALSAALKSFSREQGVTPFITLLTTFQILLFRYTGLEDVIVGTPVAGRTHLETESLIGFFANTLVMRGDLSGDPTFAELLGRTRELTLGAHAHGEVPFEMLVEELQPERDLGRTPLFQVMLVMQNTPPHMELPGLKVRQLEPGGAVAKFDLILFIKEDEHGLIANWEYDAVRLDGATIRRMAGHYMTLLGGALAVPGARLSQLPLLSDAERHLVVCEWNDTPADYTRGLCIHELFERQVARTPDAVAVVCGRERLTYAELNRRANQLARRLLTLGVGPETPVGILLKRETTLVVALLGVLKAGGAYLPLDPSYPAERLRLMLEDACPAVLLTQKGVEELASELDACAICLGADGSDFEDESGADLPRIASDENLAYLIYTSGSTGRPKGVAIEHRSAAALVGWSERVFGPHQLAGVLASTSICFDLSIFELFVPLSRGGKVILAANVLELPELTAAREVTLINTVPSAMNELLRLGNVPDSVCAVNLAGEPLQNALAQRAYAQPGVEQVFNLYGPSEDTTYSTWSMVERGGVRQPTIGRPIANTQAYVLDSRLQPVPPGVAGELYLGGEGLARGYLNRPALTAERFVPDPFAAEPGGRLYKTGDLARHLYDGQLEFLGRLDNQVKIRGFRIEPGEIEAALLTHEAVRDCAVVPRQAAVGDTRLVAYIVGEAERVPTDAELTLHLAARLPRHFVPSTFVMLDTLPQTPSGKVDRKALPEPREAAREESANRVEPRTHVEHVLTQIWTQLLDRSVGVNENFFELGGHSLLATQVVSRVREMFRIEVPLRVVFEAVTIASLAERVEHSLRAAQMVSLPAAASDAAEAAERPSTASAPDDAAPAPSATSSIVKVPRDAAMPLSFAQQRLWFLDQLVPGNPAYNIQAAVRLSGRLDVPALERTLIEVVRRHEILRTTFRVVEGRPAQVVVEAGELALGVAEVSESDARRQEELVRRFATEESRRPFDLSRWPLLRASLLRLSEDEHVLLLTMHHIVSDGWSLGVLVEEVGALYGAYSQGAESPLAELPVQYADFAAWQRQWLRGEVLQLQLDYWRQQLGGSPLALELPTDRPRPPELSYRGARLFFSLPADLYEALRAFSRREGVTLYMTLLAAFQTLLHRYTGQSEIVIGTDIANRNRAEVEGLIGYFTNQLVLRGDFTGNPNFAELLRRVRETTLGAYAHQDMPFERLVEELQPERTLDRNPLFQVMFVFQNIPMRPPTLPGLTLRALDVDEGTTAFDLSLTMQETGAGLTGSMRYSTDLFDEATVARMLRHFENILRGAIEAAETPVQALDMVSEVERREAETLKKRRTESKLKRLKTVRPQAATFTEESLYQTSYLSPGGRLPLVMQAAVREVASAAWATRHREAVGAELLRHGAILFRDFGIASLADFKEFARAISPGLVEYGERSSPRTRLADGVYTSTDHPADQHILLHNEQSYTLNWPMKIWFYCQQPAREGGQTPIADSREIYRLLDPSLVRLFEGKSVMYVRNYGDGLGLPWREVFQTEERAEVEEHCRRAGIEFEWKSGDRLRTRQVRPAVRRHPRTGEPVWFNHALFFHVSGLAPEARAALASLGEDELPFNTLFGDATPIPGHLMMELHETYRRATVTFPWRAGDVLLLDNMLVAHGREPYAGPRKILVAMAELFQ